jgi:hypothetical protein
MARKRHKLTRKGSKRLFTHTALKTSPRNLSRSPMRGGIRI